MTAPDTTDAPLTINLFGPMQVLIDGHPLPHLRSRKGIWLLAVLTLRHGRPVKRARLAGMLWPDMDQEQAFANLRPILSELRSGLGRQKARLQSPDRHTLMLDLSDAEVDVLAFDTSVQSAKLSDLERAVTLYRGQLLEGCTEEWVFQERNSREQRCLQALQTLADSALNGGDYESASRYYKRAATLDPWWDPVRRGWMEALSKSGDRNAALQVYREFVEVLRDDPGASPDEQTTILYERLRNETRAQDRSHAVAAAQPAVAPRADGNLPHPMTELIGREDERFEVSARLRRARLVTLTGLGGIGKTRLALEVAREVAGEYPDGVWLVTLEALTDGKLVAQQIASVLGLREKPGQDFLRSLTDHMRKRRLLLVLDNCEHLMETTARIVTSLLRECVEIRILATSREALGITSETVWVVPTLAAPDPAHLPQARATLLRVLMRYESVQLFVERAQAVQPGFVLTEDNAQAVAQVCCRLEGIPLAIELAAGRARALTVSQIAMRLENYLGLLTGGSRTALSRQQTLRATLDWSYALLTESERGLLHRVSVFAGGWTPAAAEHVCGGNGIETWEVPLVLRSLVDKSLVVMEQQERGASARFRLLEMVRQYAVEHLHASGMADVIMARRRDWLVALAEEAEPQLNGFEQESWLHRLEMDHDNLRAALMWDGGEAAATDLRLAGALHRFWYMRGYWSEGRQHLSRVLRQESAQPRTAARAKALDAAGSLAYSQGDYSSARSLHEESLSIRREMRDRQGIAWSLNCLGKVAYDQGDYTAARALHEESLSIRRDLGDRPGIAWSLNSLGNIAHPRGEYEAARRMYEESLSLFKELGDRQGIARSFSCLGYVAYDRGDYTSARSLHEESLSLFKELGDKGGIAWACCCLGYMTHEQGEYASARALLADGLELFKELGDRRGVAWSLNSLGNVAHLLEEYEAARGLHEESLSIRRELGDRQGIAWSLNCLGNVAYDHGDYASARSLHEESLGFFRELQDMKGVSACLEGLAAVLAAQARVSTAVGLRGAAATLRTMIGAPLPANVQQKYDRIMEQARAAIGEEAFAVAWAEGCARTWERGVVIALTEDAPEEVAANG